MARRFRGQKSRPRLRKNRKKVFFLITEGSKTEPQYFKFINSIAVSVSVKLVSPGSSGRSPEKLQVRIDRYLKTYEPNKSDEAWIVVDRDDWLEEHLQELHKWSIRELNRGMALSNPKFEYWLLLHFEDGFKIQTASQIDVKLKQYLPNYKKNLDTRNFSQHMVEQAIVRARTKDQPPSKDWPRSVGTTVYKLVDKIIRS